MPPLPPQKIAVIGAGVAGVSAAWLLQKKHHVTLFEKSDRIGGHTNTIVIDKGVDAGIAVDTGFIVCNDKTYPNFHKFLHDLNVRWRWSDMSFGYHDERSGLQYAGTDLNGLFAQRSNLLSPMFLGMLLDIRRFSKLSLKDLADGNLEGFSLGAYLKDNGFSNAFARHYILPMGAAIWSTRAKKMLQFPARTFVEFFKNHGLLKLEDRPRWQTVKGGSHSYLKAFQSQFKGQIVPDARLKNVRRTGDGAILAFIDGSEQRFDQVVLAVHGDQVLRLLADPSPAEQEQFSNWRYEKNTVILHTDDKVLPPNRRAWASWNYTREASADSQDALSMTYHMNRLQGLKCFANYCVTLNRKQPIMDRHIIREINYTHPLYTNKSIATQKPISALSGTNRTYYCGSYLGYGFHEDAVRSAVAVGTKFDCLFQGR